MSVVEFSLGGVAASALCLDDESSRTARGISLVRTTRRTIRLRADVAALRSLVRDLCDRGSAGWDNGGGEARACTRAAKRLARVLDEVSQAGEARP